MRRLTVVAVPALIALAATVAVPGQAGSRALSPLEPVAPELFRVVETGAAFRGSVMTIQPLDPRARSDGILDQDTMLLEPAQRIEPPHARQATAQRRPEPGAVRKPVVRKPVEPRGVTRASAGRTPSGRSRSSGGWRHDPEISWYGPGLIGNGTACGRTLTRTLVGVAHRSLPCGTMITFRSHGHVVRAPVVDRGPYVGGRIFDLTYGLCKKLEHCYTGPIDYRLN